MKALELTIFPASDGTHRTFIGGLMEGYCLDCRHEDKRLTDAELAAIYWGFVQTDMLWPDARTDPDETDPDYWDAACKRWKEAEETVHRFARLPHYDEKADQ